MHKIVLFGGISLFESLVCFQLDLMLQSFLCRLIHDIIPLKFISVPGHNITKSTLCLKAARHMY